MEQEARGTRGTTREKRPPALSITSLAQLYHDFESLFLQGPDTQAEMRSASGHTILVYDHHFFHLVKLNEGQKLYMPDEKPMIRAQTHGFGTYTLAEGGRRAQHLLSAYDTLVNPHAVVRRTDLQRTTHVFYKRYDDGRYPFTVVLLEETTRNDEDTVLSLRTSYPCDRRMGKKLSTVGPGLSEVIWCVEQGARRRRDP